MAIYHNTIKPVSRKAGRSATASAAYRAAALVHDYSSGESFDYRRKRGVEHAEIVLPTECAKRDINWARDREVLWNAAEIAENRRNSRVAREHEIALPHELSKAQRVELAREYAMLIANRYGVAVDFALHAPHRLGDQRNWHAHLFATTRVIGASGLGEKAAIEWSNTDRRRAGLGSGAQEIEALRELWENTANQRFRELGLSIRIDRRSLEAQGIEREPQSHKGPAVSGMERRGIETEVGKRLEREALQAAQRRLERAAELGQLQREERELTASILDVSGNIERAKRERESLPKPPAERSRESAPSLDELQQQGRENWLALRAEQKTPERSPEHSAEKAVEKRPEQARSIDEERQHAVERWRDYRRRDPEGHPGREPVSLGRSPQRSESEKDLERGQERDGPELE